MDVIDWLNAAVNASGIPKKTIAEKAGLSSASALSRILHRQAEARHHQLEAIATAIGEKLSSYYTEERPPVDVRDAHHALRVLTAFVKQHETPAASTAMPVAGVAAKPKRASTSNTKSRASAKSQRSHVVRPFHAAANPNAILLNSDDDDD